MADTLFPAQFQETQLPTTTYATTELFILKELPCSLCALAAKNFSEHQNQW